MQSNRTTSGAAAEEARREGRRGTEKTRGEETQGREQEQPEKRFGLNQQSS